MTIRLLSSPITINGYLFNLPYFYPTVIFHSALCVPKIRFNVQIRNAYTNNPLNPSQSSYHSHINLIRRNGIMSVKFQKAST